MKKSREKLPINKILRYVFKLHKKESISTIILLGSAARNELTSQRDEKGKIVSDIEIAILKKSFIDSIIQRGQFYLNVESFRVEILVSHIYFLKFLKTPLIYDFKFTGKTLWGKNVKKSIWIKKEDQIPYWEGIRLLYNRLIPFELVLLKISQNKKIDINDQYLILKMVIALGEFLMIRKGVYFASYLGKLEYFENLKSHDKLIKMIIQGIRYKLNLEEDFDYIDKIQYVSKYLFEILNKINPVLHLFEVSPSVRVFDFLTKIRKKKLRNICSKPEILTLYNKAYVNLKSFVNSNEIFQKKEKSLKILMKDWKNCIEIQSSFI